MDIKFYERDREKFTGQWWCPALTSDVGSASFIPCVSYAVKPTATIKK